MLQFIRLATTGDPHLPTARVLREAMATGIQGQVSASSIDSTMDKTQRAVFYQWLHLALNPSASDAGADAAAGGDVDPETQASRERAGRRYRDQSGRPHVNDAELNVDFRAIARIGTNIFVTGECRPLRDFVAAKIVGQKLLVAGARELPLVEAVPKFLLCVSMILWTSKALAAGRGLSSVEDEDVRQAIRHIDRTLGQIPTSALPEQLQKVYDWVMLETDLVEAAIADLLT